MGYRLSIECKNNPELRYYGTKLYGYVNKESDLLSYKYLLKIGKIHEIAKENPYYETINDIIWDYGCDNEVCLTSEQFAEFVEHYSQDLCDKYDSLYSLSFLRKIVRIIAEPGDKIIEWS